MDAFLDITRSTATILRHRAATMFAWVLAGLVIEWIATDVAIRIATHGQEGTEVYTTSTVESILATFVFALGVTLVLLCAIGALLTRDLVARHRDLPVLVPGSRTAAITDGMLHALLPFLVFYGAWGLFVEDFHYLQLSTALEGGSPVQSLEPTWFLVTAIALLLVRLALQSRTRLGSGRVRTVAGALLEGQWMVFALVGLAGYVSQAWGWLGSRAITQSVSELWASLTTTLSPDLDLPLDAVLGTISDAFVLPLVWLTIGLTVLVGDLDVGIRSRVTVGESSRAARLAWQLLTELREKYVPLLQSLRHALRAGLTTYLAFALAYALVVLVGGYVDRALYLLLVAPAPFAVISAASGSISVLVELLVEPIRLAVVAAGVGVVLERSLRMHGRLAYVVVGGEPTAPLAASATGEHELVE